MHLGAFHRAVAEEHRVKCLAARWSVLVERVLFNFHWRLEEEIRTRFRERIHRDFDEAVVRAGERLSEVEEVVQSSVEFLWQ